MDKNIGFIRFLGSHSEIYLGYTLEGTLCTLRSAEKTVKPNLLLPQSREPRARARTRTAATVDGGQSTVDKDKGEGQGLRTED